MSMKVDGSSVQSLPCESEVQSCQPQAKTQSPAPVQQAACIDTLEPARVQERTRAGERDATEELLHAVLQQVPRPGLAEYEMSLNLLHAAGTRVSVTAERDASGEFLVRLAGKGTLGVPVAGHHASVEQRLEAGASFRFKTPEAAADFLAAVVASRQPTAVFQAGELAARVGHYTSNHLARVEVSGEVGVHLTGTIPLVVHGAAEASGRLTAQVDLERGALVMEQALVGEATGRASIALARAGVQGEVTLKARSEQSLPREELEALRAGRLSLADALRGLECDWKLIGETVTREEVGTVFAGAPAAVQKLEVEFHPGALLDEDHSTAPLHGERTQYWTKDKAFSTGVDLPGFNFLVRAAVYDVSKTPFLGHHETSSLQSELDGRRALTH